MSVPKSRRNQARTEYVWQASLLASKVGAMCSRLPKRWSFTRTQFIIGAANKCMEEAARANAIYATNEREAALRMEHLQEAMASAYVVEAYADQLALDRPTRPCDAGRENPRPCVTDGMLSEVGLQCASVERLIRAVIKHDRAKWSRKRPNRKPSRLRERPVSARARMSRARA